MAGNLLYSKMSLSKHGILATASISIYTEIMIHLYLSIFTSPTVNICMNFVQETGLNMGLKITQNNQANFGSNTLFSTEPQASSWLDHSPVDGHPWISSDLQCSLELWPWKSPPIQRMCSKTMHWPIYHTDHLLTIWSGHILDTFVTPVELTISLYQPRYKIQDTRWFCCLFMYTIIHI